MLLLWASALLAACATPSATAPVDRPPALPATPPAFVTSAGAVMDAEAPAPADGAWWQVLGDPALDQLVLRAERGNTSLAAAAARVAAARAVLGAAQAVGRPQLQASSSAGRQDGPLVNAAGTQGTLVTAGLQLSYELDLSGRLSATQQAAALDTQARERLLRSARLLVQAEVAHTYLALRAVQAEQALARLTLQSWQHTLAISQTRLAQGSQSLQDLLGLQGRWQTAQAQQLALDRRQAELRHTLAMLLGEVPGDLNLALDAPPAWTPPAPPIPSGLPSTLLLRRPDVAAAALQFQAAQARAQGAQRAVWPNLTLSATAGQASATLAELLHPAMRAYSLGALLAAPLFDGGRRAAGIDQAQAEQDLALAQHRERVLVALQEVEDQLVALQVLAAQTGHHALAAEAARSAAQQAERQWHAGLASQLALLEAQRSAWQAQTTLLQTQAARAQATVGLIRALGGGWGDSVSAPSAAGARSSGPQPAGS